MQSLLTFTPITMADAKKPQTLAISLPIDIISNILSRLSVKDVTRLKTVNKPWFNLISSLHFCHQHFNSQSSHFQDRIFLFVGTDGCLYYSNLDISNFFNPKKINFKQYYFFKKIVGSCNGLLLCTGLVDSCSDNSENVKLIVVNPSTMQCKVISIAFCVYGDMRDHGFGFGYDFEADDYKVVRIIQKRVEEGALRRSDIAVFSLRSECWKIIEHDLTGGFFHPWSGVLINNHMLHWFFYGEYGLLIRSFDVCTEQWSDVPYPVFSVRSSPVIICVFDDRLCLLTQQKSSVFLMDVYGVRDSWIKLFDCSEIVPGHRRTYPVFYNESRSEILVVERSRLFWYNTTLKTCREIQSHTVFHPFAQPSMCTRSLVPLPGCG